MTFAPDDYRRTSPRSQGENFARDLATLDAALPVSVIARARYGEKMMRLVRR
jgi:hypothetical protein